MLTDIFLLLQVKFYLYTRYSHHSFYGFRSYMCSQNLQHVFKLFGYIYNLRPEFLPLQFVSIHHQTED